MIESQPTPEKLAPSDASGAAITLARAFCDNPTMLSVLRSDSPEMRQRLLVPCMNGFVSAVQRYGIAEAIKIDGKVVAVSLVYGPGAFPPPWLNELIVAPGPIRSGIRRALRFAALDRFSRRRHLRDPHYYLWFLGVAPELQGRGLGSRLLKSLNDKAVAASTPLYLETDKPSSVKLYQSHGYDVTHEETHPTLDFKMWFMTNRKTQTR